MRDQGERVQLYFHDNGPGLSAEALAGLFTPFHTTKPEGLGLGLVISRDIVAEFGGELRAADATDPEFPAPHGPGRGALFILTLRKASPFPHHEPIRLFRAAIRRRRRPPNPPCAWSSSTTTPSCAAPTARR